MGIGDVRVERVWGGGPKSQLEGCSVSTSPSPLRCFLLQPGGLTIKCPDEGYAPHDEAKQLP